MKNFIARIFKGAAHDTEDKINELPTTVAAGQVYSFKTKPYSEFSPPATDRYAAFKILRADDKHITVAVLDGIWPGVPTLKEARKASIVDEHRFAHTGRPAVFGVNREWWTPADDLDELRFVGMLTVSSTERSFAAATAGFGVGSRFSTIHAVDYTAEGEWRWSNDRDTFISESQQKKAKDEAERAAKEERYRNRLSKLTWDQLLSETSFSRWSPSPPFPPEDFTNAARAMIRSSCKALKELGQKPRRADVRAILKKTVLWFNDADEKAGRVIETEEREDICAVLEEMAYVARQEMLVDEINEWREW
jgi:hypothetical protein